MQYVILTFKYFLKRVFGIREGEFSRALLMQANMFLLVSSILIIKPAVNALFIYKFGVEKLPLAFILVAITAAIVSVIYSRYLKSNSLIKIIFTTFYLSGFALLLFWVLLRFNYLEGWVLFAFYIWSVIFAVLSASQFWILANMIFNAREAKRLFGFIGSGAIAGGIFGGYLTSILAELINSENLLLVCLFFLLISMYVTKKIWKVSLISQSTIYKEKKRSSGFAEHPFNLIRNSKHLTYLASIVGISVVVAKLVEYQFSAVASAKISDPDELTAFFGFWFSNLNMISLLVQLFVTRRVVGVFGVGTSLLFLPAGIFIGAVAILIMPELWAVILLKTFDGSLKQSVNKAGIELLALPVPAEIKTQTKPFIDVFVDSIATGIGGVILVIFVSGLNISVRLISLLIIVLLFFWFQFIKKIRNEYINSFKIKLENNGEGKKKEIFDLGNESILGGIKKILDSGGEKQKLFVLNKMKEIQNVEFLPQLLSHLNSPSSKIKLEVLRNLYFYKESNYSAEVSALINEDDPELREEALTYILSRCNGEYDEYIRKYIESENISINATALFCVAEETRDNGELQKELGLKKRTETLLKKIQNARYANVRIDILSYLIKAIGMANMNGLFNHLRDGLESNEDLLVVNSIKAAGYSTDAEFLNRLVLYLGDEKYFAESKKAILNFGGAVIDVLNVYIKDKKIDIEVRKRIPSVMQEIGIQESVDVLFQVLDREELVLKVESLKALNHLKSKFPYFNYYQKNVIQRILDESRSYLDTLAVLYQQIQNNPIALHEVDTSATEVEKARKDLLSLLERRLDGSLERIFRLLGLKYPPDDVINVFKGIQSNKPDLRNNAIEFLDNLLEVNLKKVLIPIVETAILTSISEEAIKELKIRIPNEFECFEMLLNGNDVKVQLSVLYLISMLRDPQYRPLLNKYSTSENQKIQQIAKQSLAKIQQAD